MSRFAYLPCDGCGTPVHKELAKPDEIGLCHDCWNRWGDRGFPGVAGINRGGWTQERYRATVVAAARGLPLPD